MVVDDVVGLMQSLSRSGDDTTSGEESRLPEKLRALASRGGVSALADSRSLTGAGGRCSDSSSSSDSA